jgi:hypothetical protein
MNPQPSRPKIFVCGKTAILTGQADAVMAYWRAAMKMGVAISCMHNFGVPEGICISSSRPKIMGRLSRNIGWHGQN